MLISDLRTKSDEELNNLINDLKAELFMLRFQNSTGQLDKPHKISVVKKDIAKVFTVLYEHEKGITIKNFKKTTSKQVNKESKNTIETKKQIKDTKKIKLEQKIIKPIKEGK